MRTITAIIGSICILSGCTTLGGTQEYTSRDALTGALIGAQILLIVESEEDPSPETIQSIVTQIEGWAATYVEPDSPEAASLKEAATFAYQVYLAYKDTGTGDWRAALLSLLAELNKLEE